MREKFETLYIWAIGIGEYLGNLYIRFYPPLAFGFAIILAIAIENEVKTCATLDDLMILLILTIAYVLMSALWIILHLVKKLENCRPPRHYRKETDR